MKMKWRVLSRGLLAGAVVLLLGAPIYPQGKKEGGGKGGGGKTQYHFNVIFEGSSPLLAENYKGDPWGVTSVTGGHGNIGASPTWQGPVPLYGVPIAQLGDAVCPCENNCGDCDVRLSGKNLTTPDLTFRLGEEDSLGTNVVMYFRFDVNDGFDNEYVYTVQPYGWADLDTYPWDPTAPSFCVPIEFKYVRIWQTSPTIKKRERQCPETFFATCEAESTDLPLSLGAFQAVIWRVANEGSLSPPPCGF